MTTNFSTRLRIRPRSPSVNRAHFIGIGGIGISALARWFLAEKWAITGSDCSSSPVTISLKKAGIRVKIGHSKANLPKNHVNMVIYSPAVPFYNPELKEAWRRGLRPLSYPEALGCLTKLYKTIAISGTHGKSTTTAMAALALTGKGFDPNVIVGTNLKEFGDKNFRKGRDRWLIIEADEWRASFLNYSPLITVVTNIDKDHLDFYKNLAEIKKTFLKFMEKTQEGGALILDKEDKNLLSMKSAIQAIAKKRDLEVVWYSTEDKNLRKILKVPGKHNISNAAAVLKIAETIGVRKSSVLKDLSRYKGSWRRFEYRGLLRATGYKAKVYDDYAHHPTEIKATLQAFREKFPRSRIICIYQPHQTKRLKFLFKEFVSAFSGADVLVLLPVYEVSGRDRILRGYDSPTLVRAIKKKFPKKEVYYLANPRKIKPFIQKILTSKPYTSSSSSRLRSLRTEGLRLSEPNGLSPVLVMMGAGNIVNYTPLLLKSSKSYNSKNV